MAVKRLAVVENNKAPARVALEPWFGTGQEAAELRMRCLETAQRQGGSWPEILAAAKEAAAFIFRG